MLPLPFSLDQALSYPLQRLATICGTFLLQTFGYPAWAEGNVIMMDEIRLRVVDACSGLGMLMTFFALATALALIAKAPLPDRLGLVVSAIPIAVLANVLRITATGMAYYHLGPDSETAYAIMHDLAGWLMMPLALALLWLELNYLGWLLVPVEERQPVLAYSAE
jgi:exosortase